MQLCQGFAERGRPGQRAPVADAGVDAPQAQVRRQRDRRQRLRRLAAQRHQRPGLPERARHLRARGPRAPARVRAAPAGPALAHAAGQQSACECSEQVRSAGAGFVRVCQAGCGAARLVHDAAGRAHHMVLHLRIGRVTPRPGPGSSERGPCLCMRRLASALVTNCTRPQPSWLQRAGHELISGQRHREPLSSLGHACKI